MDIRTAKVVKAEPTGRTWSSPNGTFHVHAIEFDNSDRGEYSSKSEQQNKLVVGQSATYEFTPAKGNFPAKIKPVQAQGSPSNSNGKEYVQKYPPPATTATIGNGDLATCALTCANDIYIAYNSTIKDKEFTLDHMFALADKMYNWLKERE